MKDLLEAPLEATPQIMGTTQVIKEAYNDFKRGLNEIQAYLQYLS